MCVQSPVRNLLIPMLISIFSAGGIIIEAAIASGSWLLSWTASFGMMATATGTGLAIVFCSRAVSVLDTFCECADPGSARYSRNLRNVLVATNVVLGIQATSCLDSAAAWFPVVGHVLKDN